ncbi:unnamed protein product, partial [Tuber aestivum]
MGSIGIPIKLLNEAQGHVCTLELTSGQIFRGRLFEGTCPPPPTLFPPTLPTNPSTSEDNMNVQLRDITVTARDGRVSHLDQVYIRGSHVRFFIVPDMLRYVFRFAGRGAKGGLMGCDRNAPMFRSRAVRGRGVGLARGRATVNRARGQQ